MKNNFNIQDYLVSMDSIIDKVENMSNTLHNADCYNDIDFDELENNNVYVPLRLLRFLDITVQLLEEVAVELVKFSKEVNEYEDIKKKILSGDLKIK